MDMYEIEEVIINFNLVGPNQERVQEIKTTITYVYVLDFWLMFLWYLITGK